MLIKRTERFSSCRKEVSIFCKLSQLNASYSSFQKPLFFQLGVLGIWLLLYFSPRDPRYKVCALEIHCSICCQAALVGKKLLWWTTAVTSSSVHKLWNMFCVINLNTAIWKVRKQAAECCSLTRYNLGSLSTVCRIYWEPLGWMTNLSHFHAFLDTFKLLLMLAPVADLSLLEAISVILVPTTYNLILRVVCTHLRRL